MFWFIVGILIGLWLARDSKPTAGLNSRERDKLIRYESALTTEIQKSKSKSATEAMQRVWNEANPQSEVASAPAVTAKQSPPSEPHQPLDGTTLLLYFGAFLFITAIGLFVAFADIDGVIRTFLVGLVALTMFGIGFWLIDNKPKLKEAGLTFVAIGMAAIPFIGIASYNFIFEESSGGLVWFVTSAVAMSSYVYVYLRLKTYLIAYMVIGSLVSLFLAGVSIIEAPIYYFNWAFIAAGLVLQFAAARQSTDTAELNEASAQSARVLIPLAVVGSLLFTASEGSWQFAVTLALAALYYLMMLRTGPPREAELNYRAAHWLAISAAVSAAYSLDGSFTDSALALLAVQAVHVAILLIKRPLDSALYKLFVDICLLVPLATVIFSLGDTAILAVSLAGGLLTGLTTAVVIRRYDGLVMALGSWVLLGVVFGQFTLHPQLSFEQQTWLSLASALPLVFVVLSRLYKSLAEDWRSAIDAALIALQATALVFAGSHDITLLLSVSFIVIGVNLLIRELTKSPIWTKIAAATSVLPPVWLLLSEDNSALALSSAVIATLLVNIVIALRYQEEWSRWVSTGMWLLLPFAIGYDEWFGLNLESGTQMILYALSAVALALSQAIARGRLFMNPKATLASLAKTGSFSYRSGLAVAVGMAVLLAFISPTSAASSAFIIFFVGLVSVGVGVIVERDNSSYSLLPFFVQLSLLRLFEPYGLNTSFASDRGTLELAVIAIMVVPLAGYLAVLSVPHLLNGKPENRQSLLGSLVMAQFLAPILVLFSDGVVWAMPFSAIVASLVLMYHNHQKPQASREATGYVLLTAVYWFMLYHGITNLQAYTHVLALLFAAYAWWRHRRGETERSDDYLRYMLTTATIPLVLQALFGEAGDSYGLWLLVEQVFFVLLGVSLKKEFVTKWGLYVAVGAVLYQLRALGYALLSVLALFIIGIAIYRASKQPEK